MNDRPDIKEIERWYPERWSEIAGNHVMKAVLQAFVKSQKLFNMLFTGEYRSGKNRTVALAVLSYFCRNRTETLDPCHQCRNCKALFHGQCTHWGIWSALEGLQSYYLYWVADEINKQDLETLVKTANNENQPILLHIDEIDALSRPIQHLLLTKLDVRQTVYCIGTAASVKGKPIKVPRSRRTRARKHEKPRDPLVEAFRLRFTIHHHTQRPDRPEMVEWLKARCLAWTIEADSEGTLEYLAERTGCRPGLALKVLATSTLFGRCLTRPIVDYHNFDANE